MVVLHPSHSRPVLPKAGKASLKRCCIKVLRCFHQVTFSPLPDNSLTAFLKDEVISSYRSSFPGVLILSTNLNAESINTFTIKTCSEGMATGLVILENSSLHAVVSRLSIQ